MSRKRSQVVDELNPDITPLIDILFILLIFFMVSSVFKKDEVALLLNLPKSTSKELQEISKTQNIVILVNQNKMLVNDLAMTLENLEEFTKGVSKKDIPVDLKIDKDVKYSKVIEIMDILKKNELNNLAFITDPK